MNTLRRKLVSNGSSKFFCNYKLEEYCFVNFVCYIINHQMQQKKRPVIIRVYALHICLLILTVTVCVILILAIF